MTTPTISMEGFGVRSVDVRVHRHPYRDAFDVHVRLVVDRDRYRGTGAGLEVQLVETISRDLFDDAVRAHARRLIVRALAHEVDEWLSIDGERTDPHAGETP